MQVNNFAKILGVENYELATISISLDLACRILTGISYFSRSSKSHVSQKYLPIKHIVNHKFSVNCLRSKATSKIDVSRYKTKLIYAIVKDVPFPLPHTIILHVDRIVKKSKGQQPFGSKVTKIF